MTARTVGEERRKGCVQNARGDYMGPSKDQPGNEWFPDRRNTEPPRAYTDRTDRRQAQKPFWVTEELIELACKAAWSGALDKAPYHQTATPRYDMEMALEAVFAALAPDRRQHTRRIADRQGGARFG